MLVMVIQLVPYNYDFSSDEDCDGIFLSNGPGDPQVCWCDFGEMKM